MARQPDPSEVDVSGRGETQPEDEDAAKRFAGQTDRQGRHNEPSGDSSAMRGPAEHADDEREPDDERETGDERPARAEHQRGS